MVRKGALAPPRAWRRGRQAVSARAGWPLAHPFSLPRGINLTEPAERRARFLAPVYLVYAARYVRTPFMVRVRAYRATCAIEPPGGGVRPLPGGVACLKCWSASGKARRRDVRSRPSRRRTGGRTRSSACRGVGRRVIPTFSETPDRDDTVASPRQRAMSSRGDGSDPVPPIQGLFYEEPLSGASGTGKSSRTPTSPTRSLGRAHARIPGFAKTRARLFSGAARPADGKELGAVPLCAEGGCTRPGSEGRTCQQWLDCALCQPGRALNPKGPSESSLAIG